MQVMLAILTSRKTGQGSITLRSKNCRNLGPKIFLIFLKTKKQPLCGYILGVPIHTTTYDQHWGGDETPSEWFKD